MHYRLGYRRVRTSIRSVTVSDGQGGVTPVTVQVAVLPGVFENSNTPGSTQANPSGVAITVIGAYVANQGTNTVRVLDTKTGAVVGNPIAVVLGLPGWRPADGTKVYVATEPAAAFQ